MTPTAAYARLNKLIWMGRLPKAVISFVDDSVIPSCYGVTLFDRDFARPVIFLNRSTKKWMKTLIHEMIHVAEPSLPHGKTFDALVNSYVRFSKNIKKGYRTL
jgi:hypothetical protein